MSKAESRVLQYARGALIYTDETQHEHPLTGQCQDQ
ncbi:hypothetical protein QE435_001073 [Rhizobium sp. SORGH_AS 787]|uniref:Uncharacterized protein n=1 Tax=Agrobacterium larrymoorei TaxID=160699 RepID=A0AAJ2BBH6_9HYPH|nr:hypothetical protein [Rhizobium sp. SORGH_AS_0787]MDR6100893.1 hypothetical protein [Agrobacterium larrymoorei]